MRSGDAVRCPHCGGYLYAVNENRAGTALRFVAAFGRDRHAFTAKALLEAAKKAQIGVTQKQIYNALGYMVRHSRLKKLSYGEYQKP